jgi:Putative Flp pilus-assembly TadE/G-like
MTKQKAISHAKERERGQTIILVAIGLISLLAMAALAIDVVTLYSARSETQRTADATALVAAKAIADSGFTTLPSTDTHLLDGSAQRLAQNMATSAIRAMLNANNPSINQVAGIQPVLVGTPTLFFPATANPPNSNPHITVTLQVTNLPSFFARIWGSRTASVKASATAEAYNPANVQNFTPIAPKGVKPWLVANADPTSGILPAPQFINPTNGIVERGAIGEQFYLHADCLNPPLAPCSLADNPPGIPVSSTGGHRQVDYVPALVTPNAGSNVCPACAGASDYEQSIECADVTTSYQVLSCGGGASNAQWANSVNPGGLSGASALGTECLTNAGGTGNGQGQDTLSDPALWPTSPIQPHSESGPQNGNWVTISNSIVTIPIIDVCVGPGCFPANGGTVQIDGYIEAFINEVHGGVNPKHQGDIQITVLNIAGCSTAPSAANPIVGGAGSSPVPVRLITPP